MAASKRHASVRKEQTMNLKSALRYIYIYRLNLPKAGREHDLQPRDVSEGRNGNCHLNTCEPNHLRKRHSPLHHERWDVQHNKFTRSKDGASRSSGRQRHYARQRLVCFAIQFFSRQSVCSSAIQYQFSTTRFCVNRELHHHYGIGTPNIQHSQKGVAA